MQDLATHPLTTALRKSFIACHAQQAEDGAVESGARIYRFDRDSGQGDYTRRGESLVYEAEAVAARAYDAMLTAYSAAAAAFDPADPDTAGYDIIEYAAHAVHPASDLEESALGEIADAHHSIVYPAQKKGAA